MQPKTCFFLYSEASDDIVYTVDKVKKTRAKTQVQATYCIYCGAELGSIRQITAGKPRQTNSGWLERTKSVESGKVQ